MSWIEDRTNHSDEYWVARVQQLIADHTVLEESGHGQTDEKWVHKLVDEVVSNLPPPDPPYDGNMGIAARLGYILCLWFTNTQLAKCFDSHRPTYVRQQAFSKLEDWKIDVFKMMTDMSKLPTYYPGQPWDMPFAPEAKSGDFL
jgi:hypothetical protein